MIMPSVKWMEEVNIALEEDGGTEGEREGLEIPTVRAPWWKAALRLMRRRIK